MNLGSQPPRRSQLNWNGPASLDEILDPRQSEILSEARVMGEPGGRVPARIG